MSTDINYSSGSGRNSPPTITPTYGPGSANEPENRASARGTRCATGFSFLKSIHGILNVVIIIALVCVIISAAVTDKQNAKAADKNSWASKAKVSAFHTRNAVLVFACFGLFLILVDTILHVTALINRLPAIFDTIFIIIMLVLGAIYLILGCCAAAWEKKMRDTQYYIGGYKHKGAAASASFFLFVSMAAVIINFALRLIRPTSIQNP